MSDEILKALHELKQGQQRLEQGQQRLEQGHQRLEQKMDSRFDALEKTLGDHMAATSDNFGTITAWLRSIEQRLGDGDGPRRAVG